MGRVPPRLLVVHESIERDLKRLEKRYPHVREDFDAACRFLEAGVEAINLWPNAYPGFGARRIWKGRVINRDVNRGKSGGYRLIWEMDATDDGNVTVILLYMEDLMGGEQRVRAEIVSRL
jgi:mRNA-degrading endonuclease RelE of RelBE toxin-antitoxin system